MKLKYRHNGETHSIPFSTNKPTGKRLAIRHNNQNFYASLVSTNASLASNFRIVFGGTPLFLEKASSIMPPPPVEDLSITITRYDHAGDPSADFFYAFFTEAEENGNFEDAFGDAFGAIGDLIGEDFSIEEFYRIDIEGSDMDDAITCEISFAGICSWGAFIVYFDWENIDDWLVLPAEQNESGNFQVTFCIEHAELLIEHSRAYALLLVPNE